MTLELFQDVALTQNFPQYQLKSGDIATLLDFVPHPEGKEEGCILEVFNALGESIAVVTVPISGITALKADDILAVRSSVNTV